MGWRVRAENALAVCFFSLMRLPLYFVVADVLSVLSHFSLSVRKYGA